MKKLNKYDYNCIINDNNIKYTYYYQLIGSNEITVT